VSDSVGWLVDLAVRPGRLDDAVELTAAMVRSALAEPGTCTYRRFFSADGSRIHAVERYRSSPAAVAHLRAFNEHFAERLLAVVERRGCWVHGPASVELQTLLAPLQPTYLPEVYGFDRPV
jgi:quinol monooxygenase YgiN